MSATPATVLPSPSTTFGPVTQARVLVSEWTKLRSLRSTMYALLATFLLTMGLGILAGAITASRWTSLSPHDKADFNALTTSLLGVEIGILAIGVLGVLVVTAEYSTGMVRSTFAAVPKRLPVLWGKVAVYSAVALAVSIPATLIAFFGAQAFLASENIQIGFTHAGVPRAVLGAALYLGLGGLFGLGLGAILRNTAAGISAFVAIMFVIPPLIGILPESVANSIEPYLPSHAGQAIMKITSEPHLLSPWAGLGVFAGYTALSVAIAAVLLVKRDV
jgi:ABC-2 type transport system permease protein